MKTRIKTILYPIIALVMIGIIVTACNDDNEVNGGAPVIHYVRITDPASADSLLVAGQLGNLIAIIGDNLGNTRELWFNDQEASLTPTYITATSILVNIPSRAPMEVSNKMKLVFKDGSEMLYDFVVDIPAPVVGLMSNEYAGEGETIAISGNYFFDPITVTFTGGAVGQVSTLTQGAMELNVPEGAQPGPVTISTNFGTTISSFHYKDERNIILNYDDLTAAGSWRPGPIGSDNGIDGNYLKLFGKLDANQRAEDNFESQFWGHTRNPEGNLFTGEPENLVLKFETRVVEWYGSYLQICWGPWSNANNQEVWSNLNGRGIWGPWEAEDKSFSTNGKWYTVTIPLTEMKYRHEQQAGQNVWIADRPFDKNVAGSLSFWIVATPDADASPVEIHIDNVRIVNR